MSETNNHIELAAEIVSAYVSNNSVPASELATLLGDMLKGTVAALLAKQYGGQDLAVLAALGAFLGHLFPVWLKFKGGKGVATYIGLLLGLAWPAAIVFCLVWLAVAALTRYSSLAA